MDSGPFSMVDGLESRVDSLERRLFDRIEETRTQQSLVDSLIAVSEKVRNLTAGRKGPGEKFNEIGSLLNNYEDIITNPDIVERRYDEALLYERVISEEERIRKEAEVLQEVDTNKKALDDPSIRNYDKLAPKLQQLRLNTMAQAKEHQRINEETKKLVETYNQITNILKTQIAAWDLKLKRLEENQRANGGRKKSYVEEFD